MTRFMELGRPVDLLVLFNTLKTSGMLATKLVNLKTFPALWRNKQSLRAIGARLAERVAELERAPSGVIGGDSESDLDTDSAGTTHVAIPTCAHEAVHARIPLMHRCCSRSTFCRRCGSNHEFERRPQRP